MEHLNRIEIRGIVGSVVKSSVGDTILSNLTIATSHVFKDSNGNVVIETTWHQVVAYEDIDIKKGDKAYVVGRLSLQRYTNSSGEEKSLYKIIAKRVVNLKDEKLEFETNNI